MNRMPNLVFKLSVQWHDLPTPEKEKHNRKKEGMELARSERNNCNNS
jgi:hypothetical protein